MFLAALLWVATATGWASAQTFDANRYYQQCLRFEASGNYETAKQSCLNALQVDPDFTAAELALARVELALGELASAESRLERLRNRSDSVEPFVLLAEIALRSGRLSDAEIYLTQGRERPEALSNRALAARLAFLSGEVAKRRGEFKEALEYYSDAISADGLNSHYRLTEARLRLQLGDPANARDELEDYLSFSGDNRNPELLSLLGRAYWAMSELEAAANQLELAVAVRSSRETEAQARDLRALALIYYGQGDLRSGGLALREALRRGNLLEILFSNALLWLLLLVILVAGHLVAESRIDNVTRLEVDEGGPRPWTVGQIYGILITSVVLALAAAIAYGVVIFDNYLAMFTPLQEADVRAVFFIVFAVISTALTIRRVRRNGFQALDRLLGGAQQLPLGLLLGLVLLAATLAYLAYVPPSPWLGPFYLDLARLTPLLVAALVLIPLTEMFFRAFAYPALEYRYDQVTAMLVAGGLSALVFVTPVLLLLAFGLALTESFRRTGSGLVPLVAQLVLHLGLAIGVAFVPWVHALFLGG